MHPLLAELKSMMSKVEAIDLNGDVYKDIIALLDMLTREQLIELKEANIKFISSLAIIRLNRSSIYH
jgi:hypothetical protein